MFEDGLVLVTPVCEALQYIGLSPSFVRFNGLLASLAGLSLLDLSVIVEFGTSRYWHKNYMVASVCGAWVCCVLLKYTRITRKLPDFLSDWVYSAAMTLMPAFSQILFIPLVGTLLSLFNCKYASGPELTDAFLEDDCTQ